MNLYIPNPHGPLLRIQKQLVADGYSAVQQRPCHDGAEALYGKGAVDIQPGRAVGATFRQPFRHRLYLGDEVRKAPARKSVRLDDIGVGGRRIGQLGANVLLDQLPHVFVDRIGLRDDDEILLDAQERQNIHMLDRLRHDAFIGVYDQQHHAQSGQAGDHVLDKSLVAGNVDDAGARAVGQIQIGEAQVNRQAPPLFFLRRIRIDTGQGLYQGRLAMVYVAGRPDDDMSCHLRTASLFFIRHLQPVPRGMIQALAGKAALRQQRRQRPFFLQVVAQGKSAAGVNFPRRRHDAGLDLTPLGFRLGLHRVLRIVKQSDAIRFHRPSYGLTIRSAVRINSTMRYIFVISPTATLSVSP